MKYFFLILFFAVPLSLQGQEIKVNVVFKNEPLPYSYVSVNGTPIDIANTSGIARIPVNKLNLGDTITSSMLGLLPVSLIYDQQIQQNQSCELVHTAEDVYDLSEVTAIGYSDRSSRKIFNKVVKTYPRLLQNCFVSAKFTSIITHGTTHPVNGSFVLENNIPKRINKPLRFYYFDTPPNIETNSDTTNLSKELLMSIHSIYPLANDIIVQLYAEQRKPQIYTSMSYLGLREGRHFFSYSCFHPNDFAVIQIFFEADSNSQELTNVKFMTFGLNNNSLSHIFKDDSYSNVTVNILCQKLTKAPTKGFGKATITIPENIEATITKTNGTTIKLKIYDTSIKFQE